MEKQRIKEVKQFQKLAGLLKEDASSSEKFDPSNWKPFKLGQKTPNIAVNKDEFFKKLEKNLTPWDDYDPSEKWKYPKKDAKYQVKQNLEDLNGDIVKVVKVYSTYEEAIGKHPDQKDDIDDMVDSYRPLSLYDRLGPWYLVKNEYGDKYLEPEAYLSLEDNPTTGPDHDFSQNE